VGCLVESFCQFAEPGLLLLARQTDQALECFLPFLAFVFGPLARGFFERALALDPGNIQALVGTAMVDSLVGGSFFCG
jgi:hypothetical protein